MDPITRRNNSEIQQLRMGPPMKIRAQLVIGRWLAGSPTCQVLELPSLSLSLPFSLDTCIVYTLARHAFSTCIPCSYTSRISA